MQATAEAEPDTQDAGVTAGDEDAVTGEADTKELSEERDGAPDDDQGTDSKPKKKTGYQRKLEKAEREIDDLKKKLAGTPAVATPETAPKPKGFDKPKPRLDDFASIEEHTDATVAWAFEKRDFESTQAAEAKASDDATKQLLARWNSGQAEAKKAHADYSDVMEAAEDVKLNRVQQRLILESEHSGELAYALAKDLESLKKYAKANPVEAARILGRFEAKISSDAPQPKTRVSGAPTPIRPTGGSRSTGSANANVSEMSLADYRRWRDKK